MTRQQHLQFCNNCTKRKMDLQQGVICSLTERQADFEVTCPDFEQDNSIQKTAVEQTLILDPETIKQIRSQQNLGLGILGGFAGGIIGAILWAIITVATEYQIGYMALAIGFLVGYGVRILGKGIDQQFGFCGAVIAVIGCLLGNYFAMIGFASSQYDIPFMEVLFSIPLSEGLSIIIENAGVIDVLFIAIAAFQGYKFAFVPEVPENLRK